jgi:hypothetical protein
MLTYSPALQAILNQTKTKVEYTQKINEVLGSNRRVRCFRDGNAGATDPSVTGVEFLNIGNTGTIVMQGGDITSIGSVSGATIQNGADLTTGLSILSIEGNGNWVRGTLGLVDNNLDTNTANDVDFTMSVQPSNNCGYKMDSGIRAPRLMPSGTGPVAPELDPRRPAFMEFYSYINEDVPVLHKTVAISTRQDDLIFEDAELSHDMGDVRVTTTSDTIVFGTGGRAFEFSGLLLSMTASANSQDPTKPVHQFLASCKPHGRWPTYPMLDTYNRFEIQNLQESPGAQGGMSFPNIYQPNARLEKVTFTCVGPAGAGYADGAMRWSVVSDVVGPLPDAFSGVKNWNYREQNPEVPYTFAFVDTTYVAGQWFSFNSAMTYNQAAPADSTVPHPFKIVLKTADGAVLHTYEMRDGLPINSKFMSQVRTSTQALRPHFNCGMMLPWQSHRPKMNWKAYKTHPGMMPDFLRPTMAQLGHSTNGTIPLIAGREQMNSANQYGAMPRWPMSSDTSAANDVNDPNNNPYTYDNKIYGSMARATGWDYEPGSISGHDWLTGPGGVRYDRQAIPHMIALYLGNPNGTRLRDGSSYQDNLDAWAKAYFNHSCHYVQDMTTFDTFPDKKAVYGGAAFFDNYYGSALDYVAGGKANHAILSAIPAGASGLGNAVTKDAYGLAIWNGWAMDALHAYGAPGYMCILFNSPMFLVAAKHRYIAVWMAQQAAISIKKTTGFLERTGAWRWLSFAQMWKLGTKSNLGIARAVIEDRWRIDCENIHRDFVVPTTDPNHPQYNEPDFKGLRYLGMYTLNNDFYDDGNTQALITRSGALCYYISTVFVLMKTSGSWDAMYNKNQKCRETLEFMMRCYDLYAVDAVLDSNGTVEGGYPRLSKPLPYRDANGAIIKPWLTPEIIEMPTSWAQWATWYPAVGQESWVTEADGVTFAQRDAGQHNRAQWAYMRKDFFPEFPYPRLDAAIAKYDEWYAWVSARVAARTPDKSKAGSDWFALMPGMGRIKPPIAS